jgi:hypothetical protein
MQNADMSRRLWYSNGCQVNGHITNVAGATVYSGDTDGESYYGGGAQAERRWTSRLMHTDGPNGTYISHLSYRPIARLIRLPVIPDG